MKLQNSFSASALIVALPFFSLLLIQTPAPRVRVNSVDKSFNRLVVADTDEAIGQADVVVTRCRKCDPQTLECGTTGEACRLCCARGKGIELTEMKTDEQGGVMIPRKIWSEPGEYEILIKKDSYEKVLDVDVNEKLDIAVTQGRKKQVVGLASTVEVPFVMFKERMKQHK